MKSASRLWLAYKALQELGPRSVGLYALYQLGLRTGHYQRQLATSLARLKEQNRPPHLNIHSCLPPLPNRDAMLEIIGNHVGQLYEQADEIIDGKVRLFGGQPVPLILNSPESLSDWTKYARKNQIDGQDIKYIWEPGRFGWACTLAMAYHLTHAERYAATFWQHTERFLTSNPPFYGPQWTSAQEVAIRLISLAFALQVFSLSRQATQERLEFLAQAIVTHAERIPTTMVYARSQNNNHLISEALGLYTASALLPEHPLAPKWHMLGRDWLQYAFLTQITPDGTYIQHSTNYHRLMLQAALWAFAVHDHSFSNEPILPEISTLLKASTRWLWKLVDPETGRVPNLGHNDGAYILPLTVCPYHDYRPVIHAAAHRFLHENLVPHGAWHDMGGWLCSPQDQTQSGNRLDFWLASPTPQELTSQSPLIITNQKNGSWALLRAATYHSRPAHADQLHLDLWWRGLNLAQDAGTYLYNALPPWDNSLSSAFVHNTLVIDDQEFMLRAGRFLFLNWAQAKIVTVQTPPDGSLESLTVQHNGYRSIGVLHSRQVSTYDDGRWEVIDQLDGQTSLMHSARLHWLLPDWEYEIHDTSEVHNLPGCDIRINSPFGWVSLKVGVSSSSENNRPIRAKNFQLVRAGKLLFGSGTVSPIAGWTSPTYGDKIPALACIFEISQSLPISIKSEWILPYES